MDGLEKQQYYENFITQIVEDYSYCYKNSGLAIFLNKSITFDARISIIEWLYKVNKYISLNDYEIYERAVVSLDYICRQWFVNLDNDYQELALTCLYASSKSKIDKSTFFKYFRLFFGNLFEKKEILQREFWVQFRKPFEHDFSTTYQIASNLLNFFKYKYPEFNMQIENKLQQICFLILQNSFLIGYPALLQAYAACLVYFDVNDLGEVQLSFKSWIDMHIASKFKTVLKIRSVILENLKQNYEKSNQMEKSFQIEKCLGCSFDYQYQYKQESKSQNDRTSISTGVTSQDDLESQSIIIAESNSGDTITHNVSPEEPSHNDKNINSEFLKKLEPSIATEKYLQN